MNIPTCTYSQSLELHRLGCHPESRVKWNINKKQTLGFDDRFPAYTAEEMLKLLPPVKISYLNRNFFVCGFDNQHVKEAATLEMALADHLIAMLSQ